MRAAAVAAALTAAVLLPGNPLGVGVLIVVALTAVAVGAAMRPAFDVFVFGALALALASLPLVRDATWVVALDLTAAWLLAVTAVAGPTIAAALAPVARLHDLPEWIPTLPSGVSPVVRGTALGGALLTPFGVLFWTGDAAFAALGRSIPLPSAESVPGRLLAFALAFLIAAGLALAARRPLRVAIPSVPRQLTAWEWGIPLALLDALFLVFVVVQLAVLFGGHDHVLRTAGLSYAEYARQGFWQLLGAAALTLAVIGAAVLFTDVSRRSHLLSRRLLLGLLCVLTLVIVASALRRLLLYEDAFGLTRLRLLATTASLWFGGLFVLVIAAGMTAWIRRQLPRIVIGGTAVALLALSLANPDGLIAERNIERWREGGRLDVAYLQTLSADAAPAVSALPADLRRDALGPLAARLAEDEPWSSYNLARARAREILRATHPRT